ncbi:MAG TPA: phospholipase [Ramlibacter sp.]|nr:phospholipase [Ramlibacter sp.]
MKPVPVRLAVRPSRHPSLAGSAATGVHPIPPATPSAREALVQVPELRGASGPVPLVLALHGSGGEPAQALHYLAPFAAEAGVLVVAPASHDYTWDAILGRPGADIRAIDHALHWAFDRFAVDPARLVVAGFSDGASYALALGLANGDVFPRTVALSPGFVPALEPAGQPRVFISHGTRDAVLPVERCSRRIVPQLRSAGYEVTYDEFEGGHVIPPPVAQHACRWMLEPSLALQPDR